MNDNIDLKKLWMKQETSAPDTKELFEKTKTFKMRNLLKLAFTNLALLGTAVFIGSIWYRSEPQMITTKIGSVLAILAMLLFLFVYNQLIPLFMKADYNINSSNYLQQLLKIKEKQLFLQNTMLNIYFILLSTGVFMYMLEPAADMSTAWTVFAYAATAAWVAFNWFFIRPRTIKKQQAKINELITKVEALNQQLLEP